MGVCRRVLCLSVYLLSSLKHLFVFDFHVFSLITILPHHSFTVNYFGLIQMTHACLPLLKAQAISSSYRHGRIINVLSMFSLWSGPEIGPYAGSKHAAEAFTTSLRHELSDFGIQVATINPSFHSTKMTDSETVCNDLLARWQMLDKDTRKEYGEGECSHRIQLLAIFLVTIYCPGTYPSNNFFPPLSLSTPLHSIRIPSPNVLQHSKDKPLHVGCRCCPGSDGGLH